MRAAKVQDADLKPAFLFLSGCHTELARVSTVTDDAKAAKEHHDESRRLLQKVYGTGGRPSADADRPVPSASGTFASASSSPATARTPTGTTSDGPPPKRARAGTDAGGSGSSALAAAERETQALRAKYEHATRKLGRAEQDLIRKDSELARLEKDLSAERAARRRAQDAVDAAGKDISAAQRAARSAEERAQREAEARRRVEAERNEERARREALEARASAAPAPANANMQGLSELQRLLGMMQQAATAGLPGIAGSS
jgi:hypothetical protein